MTVETLGAFIDERYAAWAHAHVAGDVVSLLKTGFADWLCEPLANLSAWRIESWRRDQLDLLAQPRVVSRQLHALDRCLGKAVDWLIIERNPLQDVSFEADTDYFIELFAGGMGHGYLREGWAPVGVNWTWTLGNRAVLELPPVSGKTDYVLKVHITGTYNADAHRLYVDVNETTVGMILCRGPASYEFFVPAGALTSREHIELVLKMPDARRPMDHGDSTDDRYLGFRVTKFELLPMTTSPQKKQPRVPDADDDLTDVLAQRVALQQMASLGFNCEFGFVQRHVGAEPMGLFRWSSVPLDKLIEGLEKRFAGLTARDALDIQVSSDGEFVAEDKVYGFRHHTSVFAFQGGVLERVQRNEYVRVGVLCNTLLEELREHKKLFVYHDAGASNLETIRRLVRALQVYGDNTLLWIVGAPSAAQIGETRQIEPGLIRGCVGGFQTAPIIPSSPHLPSWIKVACRAYQIWRRSEESQGQSPPERQRQDIRKQQ